MGSPNTPHYPVHLVPNRLCFHYQSVHAALKMVRLCRHHIFQYPNTGHIERSTLSNIAGRLVIFSVSNVWFIVFESFGYVSASVGWCVVNIILIQTNQLN